jgi:magnesium chelatase subunit H
MIGCMSAAEVDAPDAHGQVRDGWPQTGPMALLKRLRGKQEGGPRTPARRRWPCCAVSQSILRFIPGTAQDVRAYFLTMQYWLAGSDENIANMVRHLVDRYSDGSARGHARRD